MRKTYHKLHCKWRAITTTAKKKLAAIKLIGKTWSTTNKLMNVVEARDKRDTETRLCAMCVIYVMRRASCEIAQTLCECWRVYRGSVNRMHTLHTTSALSYHLLSIFSCKANVSSRSIDNRCACSRDNNWTRYLGMENKRIEIFRLKGIYFVFNFVRHKNIFEFVQNAHFHIWNSFVEPNVFVQ